MNICTEYKCPFYSEKTQGCERYTVSGHCVINQIKGVQHNQYALHIDKDHLNGHARNLFQMLIDAKKQEHQAQPNRSR